MAGLVCFYRAVSVAELEAVRASGRLARGPGSMGDGKHLWGTLEAAVAFRERLGALGWEPPAPRILRVMFAADVADRLIFLGARLDGCGPGYYATEQELRRGAAFDLYVGPSRVGHASVVAARSPGAATIADKQFIVAVDKDILASLSEPPRAAEAA